MSTWPCRTINIDLYVAFVLWLGTRSTFTVHDQSLSIIQRNSNHGWPDVATLTNQTTKCVEPNSSYTGCYILPRTIFLKRREGNLIISFEFRTSKYYMSIWHRHSDSFLEIPLSETRTFCLKVTKGRKIKTTWNGNGNNLWLFHQEYPGVSGKIKRLDKYEPRLDH